MRELYELTTLAAPLLALGTAAEGARAWVSAPEAGGTLLGAWRCDIGLLGRLLVLRRFDDADSLAKERRRALLDTDPFNGDGTVTDLRMESFAPFPFLPPIATGRFGDVYEIRTYHLKPGGLPPTIAGWQAAMPVRETMSHLVMTMYGLDGPTRIVQFWPYSGVDERFAVRARSYADGSWPPKGGPDNIIEATSAIALPEPWSPLR